MLTLEELAQIVKAELVGDPTVVVYRVRPFEGAGEGDVTFAGDAGYRARLQQSPAAAVIVEPPVPATSRNLLVARAGKLAFARAIAALHSVSYDPIGVSDDLVMGEGSSLGNDLSIFPRVTIGRRSTIGNRVTLHSGVVIGDGCTIGDDSTVHPNVSIYDGCIIGRRVIIHSGTVIGSDGFGFVPDENGTQFKLLQLGRVVIEDDCEVGANCSLDRGGFGETVLRRGVKLDNFIQVGHNTVIGENTVVAALTGFSGGTRVGRGCVIAGQVGTNQHISIGDGATITARTGVTKSVRPGALMGGMMPAQDYNAWRKSQVLYSRLPELFARIKRLESLHHADLNKDLKAEDSPPD